MLLGSSAVAAAPVLAYRGHSVGTDGKTLADRVTELLRGRNVTRIATEAGLSRTQLLSIRDGGTKHPRIETLDALAEALGSSRDFLLYGRQQGEAEATSLSMLRGILNQQRDMLLRQTESVVRTEATQLFWIAWDELESAVLDQASHAAGQSVPDVLRLALDQVRPRIEARLQGVQSDDGNSRRKSA